MTGGTLDLNGDDNQNNFPAPDGFGVITNTSPYARAVLKMGLSGGATRTFSGVIQNGNGGAMTTSIVPNSNDGVVPVVYKQGYRMDIDMAAFGDSETLVLAGANTYGGFTRIGGGEFRSARVIQSPVRPMEPLSATVASEIFASISMVRIR